MSDRLHSFACAAVIYCACTIVSAQPETLPDVGIFIETRQASLHSVAEYINGWLSTRGCPSRQCVLLQMSLAEESESPLVTLSTNTSLRAALDMVCTQSRTQWSTNDGRIVITSDELARTPHRAAYLETARRSRRTLEAAQTAVSNSTSVMLWDPETRRELLPVTNRAQIHAIAGWIGEQTWVYNEDESRERKAGAVCGCLPWVISSDSPAVSVAWHGHSLIINGDECFRPLRSPSLDSFQSNLVSAGVLENVRVTEHE